MPFFIEVRGLKKIMTSLGRDRDWAKTAVGITGLSENFVRDGGIEEPYWGPSNINLILIYKTLCYKQIFICFPSTLLEIPANLDHVS